MARVYQALKALVMAGAFAPGERIDPARLSAELNASATPIREALHRLAGERLVESWQQEGFRQPFITEASLRDLYGWSDDLLQLLLRTLPRSAPANLAAPDLPADDFAAAAAIAFDWLASLSPNREHWLAVASLNERSHALRRIEATVLPDPSAELAALLTAVATGRWAEARRLGRRYHAVRHRLLAVLAGCFRRRDA